MKSLLIPTKHKMSKYHEDFVRAILNNEGTTAFLAPSTITGKTLIMNEVKRQKFYHNVESLIEALHSDHPSDKEVVQELLSKMTKQEILLMREMLVKVGKVFYIKSK